MNNLFSIFDPKANFSLNMNWVSGLVAIMVLPQSFWLAKSKFSVLTKKMFLYLHSEMKLAIGKFYFPGMTHFLISLLTFIFLNNLWGLLPYVFTASSHLSFSLGLALPMWAGLMLWSIMKSWNSVLSHLVPLGTPSALMPFMVLIEVVSSVIRPITLSVRLAANMVAGHLLMVLLSTPLVTLPLVYFIVVYLFLIILSLLELGVSFIQGYVFSTLMSLYIGENSNPSL